MTRRHPNVTWLRSHLGGAGQTWHHLKAEAEGWIPYLGKMPQISGHGKSGKLHLNILYIYIIIIYCNKIHLTSNLFHLKSLISLVHCSLCSLFDQRLCPCSASGRTRSSAPFARCWAPRQSWAICRGDPGNGSSWLELGVGELEPETERVHWVSPNGWSF